MHQAKKGQNSSIYLVSKFDHKFYSYEAIWNNHAEGRNKLLTKI